jgi:PAS domain-containing protein
MSRVLIIEQDARVRDQLVRLARSVSWGVEAEAVPEASADVTMARGDRPNVAVVRLEGSDTLSPFKALRALSGPGGLGVPALAVSDRPDRHRRYEALEAGALDVLSLPVDAIEFREKLRACLRLGAAGARDARELVAPAVLEALGRPLLGTEVDGRLEWLNAAAAELLGVDRPAVLSRPLGELIGKRAASDLIEGAPDGPSQPRHTRFELTLAGRTRRLRAESWRAPRLDGDPVVVVALDPADGHGSNGSRRPAVPADGTT